MTFAKDLTFKIFRLILRKKIVNIPSHQLPGTHAESKHQYLYIRLALATYSFRKLDTVKPTNSHGRGTFHSYNLCTKSLELGVKSYKVHFFRSYISRIFIHQLSFIGTFFSKIQKFSFSFFVLKHRY